MKRLASIVLIVIIIMGLCTTAVTATPASNAIVRWILSDGGNNIPIEVIQYPKVELTGYKGANDRVAVNVMKLDQIIIKMDIAAAQEYFQHFNSGESIPQLVLNGMNSSERPVFVITMENCTICGYTVSELFIGRASTPLKATIKIDVEKLTTTKLDTAGTPIIVTSTPKLDTGKIFINDTEYTGFVSLSGIDGSCVVIGNGDEKTYGGVEYNKFEFIVEYDEIGTLPDWLASLNGNTGYATGPNPQCKLKYELSSSISQDKLSFEVSLNAIGQELMEIADNHRVYEKYTFRVFNLDFEVPPAVTDSAPAAPVKLFIREPNFTRTMEHSWAGNWVTTFGKMSLKQNGTQVTGEYGNPVETLEGTVSGSKLAGTWHDSLGSGKFEFTMSPDGKSFTGAMYNQSPSDRGFLEWNGDRE